MLHPAALQIQAQSENDADDELLSVVVMKGDKKVVAGTQSGVVNLYSWDHLDDCSDRFPGAAKCYLCFAVTGIAPGCPARSLQCLQLLPVSADFRAGGLIRNRNVSVSASAGGGA